MNDREVIFDYLEADSPRATILIDDRIEAQVELLIETPEIGRPGRIEGTRELVIPRTPKKWAPSRKAIGQGLKSLGENIRFFTHRRMLKPRIASWDILSRPFGTGPCVQSSPGLRPGLFSVVPSGLSSGTAGSHAGRKGKRTRGRGQTGGSPFVRPGKGIVPGGKRGKEGQPVSPG
jgi:hypothetical protein